MGAEIITIPTPPAPTPAPALPTLEEVQAAVRSAEEAAAQSACLVAPAFAARVRYWSAQASRQHAETQDTLAEACAPVHPYLGDGAAAATRCSALAAATAARRARYWAGRYSRELARQARITERST